MEILPEQKVRLYRGLKIALIVFLAVLAANFLSEGRGYRDENKTPNTISFNGHGEVKAIPDIANISFTIRKEAKTVKDAQDQVKGIEKKALESLRGNKVADTDMKTVDASFAPKYEYKYGAQAPCYAGSYCPPAGHNVIVGYEAYESISVKVRDADSTGKVIEDLGALGISELSGPNFAVEKEDSLKIEARKKAIDDAKTKAESLVKDLGVKLGHITSFNEGSNNPVPMYAKTMAVDNAVGSAPAELPKGENTISSDVTITYEIK